MQFGRSISGVVAFACVVALAVVSWQDPTACEISAAAAGTPPTLADAGGMQAERAVSLAQTSWSRAKVPFPGSKQNSCGMAVRIVLAVVLFLSAIFAYSGLPHLSVAEHFSSLEQPRKLLQISALLTKFSSGQAATSKSTSDAASRTVALLHVRSLRHRLARLDEGDDGILDDDRDSAKIQGYMARAEAYAQRQQFEKAAKLFKNGEKMAKEMLDDLHNDNSGPVELDDAHHLLSSVLSRMATFYLERGQAISAKKVLRRAATVIAHRTDAVAMKCRLLAANAHRDAGEMDDAVVGYETLLSKIGKEAETASLPEHAMLGEFAIEVRGEFARALISQGKVAEARQNLEEELEKLTPSGVTASLGQSALVLAARLKAWLAFVDLKEGYPAKAVELLDASLAGLGELPAGLSAATPEIQEMLQTRAMAKVELGRLHSASDDLEVVRGLQDELQKTIADGHNPDYETGSGSLPDPRLWASMARTRTIAAGLKFQSQAPDEAFSLAKEARNLLREVKRSDGRLPKGYNLATFVEVKASMAKAKSAKSASNFLAKREEDDESGHDDDMAEVAVESETDTPRWITQSEKDLPAKLRAAGLKQENAAGKVVIEKLKEPELELEDDFVSRVQSSVTLKKRSSA